MKRWGKPARLAVMTLCAVAFLFAFAFPTRSLLAQRSEEDGAREQLAVLQDQTSKLEAEAERLRSDEEIERLARERFNLVRPGEEAYAIVPQGTTTTTSAEASP